MTHYDQIHIQTKDTSAFIMPLNTKHVGDISQANVMAALLKKQCSVLLPFGDNQRYDLVIETPDGFHRIQCKTGRIRSGAIEFPVASSSNHRRGGARRPYLGQIDYFGVYCPCNGKTYLVPSRDLTLRNLCRLRVAPPGNHQRRHIRWASDYELV